MQHKNVDSNYNTVYNNLLIIQQKVINKLLIMNNQYCRCYCFLTAITINGHNLYPYQCNTSTPKRVYDRPQGNLGLRTRVLPLRLACLTKSVPMLISKRSYKTPTCSPWPNCSSELRPQLVTALLTSLCHDDCLKFKAPLWSSTF